VFKLGLRSAICVARISAWLSKTILKKSGETISGRVLLSLRPSAISELSKGKIVILVSGTNGKTSTTRFLRKIVEQLGSVTSSNSGSNLSWGIASSLMKPTTFAVLEIDELHLPAVIDQTKPKVVLLLNLTRDQLHRMHEVKRVAQRWKTAVESSPETTFVVDVDDPFVNYATTNAKRAVRISFGGRSHPDGAVCPACGSYLQWIDYKYKCQCGLTNAMADRIYTATNAGERNAVLANIAGGLVAAPWIQPDIGELERTIVKTVNGVRAEIRLTKNPASWTEALTSINGESVILILNSRQVDGIDTSWLFDISFEILQGRTIVVTGERALDLQYRLHVEGIESTRVPNFATAISQFEPGTSVQTLAAYTAFFELSR
jgi:hypothetical protein